MRLLNTSSLEFEEFFDSDIPPYAIPSHRWGRKEVTYKEMRKRTAKPGLGQKKIEMFCRMVASLHYLEWAWVDTCCIDKRSSAELSEAINSMYKWYRRSVVRYVYLSDVELSPGALGTCDSSEGSPQLISYPDIKQQFHHSRWFTRGWTLQELLAPEKVLFFDSSWTRIGDRQDLALEISSVTKIHKQYLVCDEQCEPISKASAARKMSYASRRSTSREEDMVYCLLGLFDVNMPLLYGEGAVESFRRLQVEILQKFNDESLFAWTAVLPASGMLAVHPNYFVGSGNIISRSETPETDILRPPYE
ncbi:MAG: hypothetical protein Q9222_006778 [Ikaeria aurantiellina]